MRHLYIVVINLLLLVPLYPVLAQNGNTDSGEGQEQSQENQTPQQSTEGSEPAIIRQEPYKYYYWPDENLDNFGLSTLGNGQGGSTLGQSLERKSNLQANPEEAPEKSQQNTEDIPGMVYPPEEGNIDSERVIEEEAPKVPASEKPIYEWVDDKGIIHITNDIGDIPLKYQNNIRKRQGSAGEQ